MVAKNDWTLDILQRRYKGCAVSRGVGKRFKVNEIHTFADESVRQKERRFRSAWLHVPTYLPTYPVGVLVSVLVSSTRRLAGSRCAGNPDRACPSCRLVSSCTRFYIHTTMPVWVDMPDPAATVPSCDGVFTAKITRLSDGRGGVAGSAGRGVHAMPAPSAGVRRDVGGGGGAGVGGGGGGELVPYEGGERGSFFAKGACLDLFLAEKAGGGLAGGERERREDYLALLSGCCFESSSAR